MAYPLIDIDYMRTIQANFKTAPSRNWMVIYTRSNWEKKSSQLLSAHGYNAYCPVIKMKKKWADRTKTVETPLFKSYIFVHLLPTEEHKILQIPGVISFVKNANTPVSISATEIDRIKDIILSNTNVELVNYKNLGVGDRVTINSGPFADQQGKVTNINGTSVLMVLEQLGCALILKIDQTNISPINTHNLIN